MCQRALNSGSNLKSPSGLVKRGVCGLVARMSMVTPVSPEIDAGPTSVTSSSGFDLRPSTTALALVAATVVPSRCLTVGNRPNPIDGKSPAWNRSKKSSWKWPTSQSASTVISSHGSKPLNQYVPGSSGGWSSPGARSQATPVGSGSTVGTGVAGVVGVGAGAGLAVGLGPGIEAAGPTQAT